MPFQYQSVTGFAGHLRLEPTHRSRMTCLPVQRSRVTNTFVLFEHNVLASFCVDRKGLRCFRTWPPKPVSANERTLGAEQIEHSECHRLGTYLVAASKKLNLSCVIEVNRKFFYIVSKKGFRH